MKQWLFATDLNTSTSGFNFGSAALKAVEFVSTIFFSSPFLYHNFTVSVPTSLTVSSSTTRTFSVSISLFTSVPLSFQNFISSFSVLASPSPSLFSPPLLVAVSLLFFQSASSTTVASSSLSSPLQRFQTTDFLFCTQKTGPSLGRARLQKDASPRAGLPLPSSSTNPAGDLPVRSICQGWTASLPKVASTVCSAGAGKQDCYIALYSNSLSLFRAYNISFQKDNAGVPKTPTLADASNVPWVLSAPTQPYLPSLQGSLHLPHHQKTLDVEERGNRFPVTAELGVLQTFFHTESKASTPFESCPALWISIELSMPWLQPAPQLRCDSPSSTTFSHEAIQHACTRSRVPFREREAELLLWSVQNIGLPSLLMPASLRECSAEMCWRLKKEESAVFSEQPKEAFSGAHVRPCIRVYRS